MPGAARGAGGRAQLGPRAVDRGGRLAWPSEILRCVDHFHHGAPCATAPVLRPNPKTMMLHAHRALGARQVARAPMAARAPRVAPLAKFRLRVAAIDEAPAEATGLLAVEPEPERKALPFVDPVEAQALELEELDAAQEQLLKWAMFASEAEQDEELDEMVDYDEFADDEYEELFEELEELYEAADVELKVGDRVVGSIYEVDEDGAYIEIGEKASGFVPVSECSFAKLKTVGRRRRPHHAPAHACTRPGWLGRQQPLPPCMMAH